MALDIEHALKTQLLLDLSTNDAEDGYNIVKQYLDADYNRLKSLYDKIGKSAASDLIQKRKDSGDDYALWEIVEVMSLDNSLTYTSYTTQSIHQKKMISVATYGPSNFCVMLLHIIIA